MKYNEVLKNLLSQLGRNVSQTDIANAIGSNAYTINKRATRNSDFSDAELKKLEQLLNVKLIAEKSYDTKPKLKDIIDKISSEKRLKVTNEKIGDVFGVSRQRVSAMLNNPVPPHRLKLLEDAFCMSFNDAFEKHPEINSDEFINIPVKGEVSASCGNGLFVYDEQQTAVYPISRHLFRSLGASQSETEIIFASGDSMFPEIKDGDALMVDKSKTEVVDGQIYIIRYDGQPLCKRLQKLPPKQLKVIADNEKYDAYYIDFSKDIDIDFDVIGRVLWYSRIAR